MQSNPPLQLLTWFWLDNFNAGFEYETPGLCLLNCVTRNLPLAQTIPGKDHPVSRHLQICWARSRGDSWHRCSAAAGEARCTASKRKPRLMSLLAIGLDLETLTFWIPLILPFNLQTVRPFAGGCWHVQISLRRKPKAPQPPPRRVEASDVFGAFGSKPEHYTRKPWVSHHCSPLLGYFP